VVASLGVRLAVFTGADRSDRRAITPGDEEICFAALEKDAPLRVDALFPVWQQWRYPKGVVFIYLPGEIQEYLPFMVCPRWRYVYFAH
jgi:hypothetical protein